MHRRSFLQIMLGASASLSLTACPRAAQAAVILPREHMAHCVSEARFLKADYARFRALYGNRGWIETPDYEAWKVRANAMVQYMLDNFNDDPTSQQCHDLFEGRLKVDAMSLDEMEGYEGLFPTAMIRSNIQIDKLPYHMSKMPAFLEYADRYRHLVMTKQPDGSWR